MSKIKVYLDKQLFSYIYRYENKLSLSEIEIKWVKELNKYIDRCEFYFSYAHIIDAKRDHSEHCVKSLISMGKYVHENYIVDDNSVLKVEKLTPLQVYSKSEIDVNNPKPIPIPEDFREKIMQVPFFRDLILKKYNKEPQDLTDDECNDFIIHFNNSSSEYRSVNTEGINKFRSLSNIDQSLFINYISGKKLTLKNYEEFYNTIEITSEKRESRKTRPVSIWTDLKHGYYASYCNYVISNDSCFLRKTSICYENFGISTQVVSMDNFISIFEND